jgi:hypothetical protein
VAAEITFTGPHAWSDSIKADLSRAFSCAIGAANVEAGVKDKSRQVWFVFDKGTKIGTLVTETVDQDTYRELFIWCYQGRDIRRVLPALAYRAYHARVEAVGFFTPHWRAVLFGFKQFRPLVENFGPPGEKRFTFQSEVFVWASRKNSQSATARSRDTLSA